MRRGVFITFEGPEGGGKSTHLPLLADHLKKQKRSVILTHEPGGDPRLRGLRRLLLRSRKELAPLAELLIYQADRAQHVESCIRPALERGDTVLCDRYTDSTLAYQSDGRGLPRRTVEALNRLASQGIAPDLTLLLDVPVRRGLRRARARRGGYDRLERAGLPFHERVRRGFLRLAKADPRRIRVIPPARTIDVTQKTIRRIVDDFLAS